MTAGAASTDTEDVTVDFLFRTEQPSVLPAA
jgi:hypothetical protein